VGSLLYRPDWEEARERLTIWWNRGDIGRPAMLVHVPRERPIEDIPALPEPEGWLTHYSTKDLPYRVNLALRSCLYTDCYGEAAPAYSSGDLAPNCLALYLGCQGVESAEDTVWCQPFIEHPESFQFRYDPEDFSWKFTLEATKRVRAQAKGKFLDQFPDLIEGLDTLAAMRGTQQLLTDLTDRPAWVHTSLRAITDLYFRYYDVLYDLIRDEVGGSVFWVWAPGRLTKLQCDFSAMISPAMFREFMVPVLVEMTERVSYSLYHWDGPGAIPHLEALLSIPRLDMIQWQPGAGNEPQWHPRWWPLYHRIFEAGKKLFIGGGGREQLLALKREFGEHCKLMLLEAEAESREQAEEYLRLMQV
jgi:5-methyltetrahydrofolate--homocysteine methyltransferase